MQPVREACELRGSGHLANVGSSGASGPRALKMVMAVICSVPAPCQLFLRTLQMDHRVQFKPLLIPFLLLLMLPNTYLQKIYIASWADRLDEIHIS